MVDNEQDDRIYVQWSGKWWRVHADQALVAARGMLDALKAVAPERVRLLALSYAEQIPPTPVDDRLLQLGMLGGDLVDGQLALEQRASQAVDAHPTRLASAQARHSTHGARR